MSLRVWLPLNGNLNNQGLDQVTVTNNGATVDNNGKIGKCYSFDGNNYITIVSNNLKTLFSSSLNHYSMACWIYLNNDETDRVIIFGNFNADPFSNWELLGDEKQRVCAGRINNYATRICSSAINKEVWVHIAFSYDGNNTVFYINGNKINSESGANTLTTMNSNIFYLGSDSRSGATRLKGKLNDFRIYDHALSPLEVKQISQGLILHYPLNRNGWGNENLHKDSDTITSTWSINQGTVSNGVVTITPSSGSDRRIYQMPASGGWNWELNKTYTASIDARSPNGAILIFCPYGAGSMNKSYTVTSQWKRYSFTFTATQSGTGSMTYSVNQASGVTLQLKYPKLELGSIATPWCPNSSDKLYNTLGLNDNIQYDTSGYGNNGTKIGSFSYDSDTPKYNVSTIFNGTERIKRNTLDGEIYTLACWAKTTKNKSTSQQIIADSKSEMTISFYNGTIIGVFGTTRGTGSKSTLGSSYKENNWNHFVVVKTGTTGERAIYCNGVLLIPTSNDYWGAASGFFVGARNNSQGNPFYGQICDVRAYATALSAQEVLSLYNNSAYIDNQGNIYGALYEEV